ncbi:unnamed protein product [Pedinophyceae sp. YPF-701]|nr:unnamed protein product [Pedinophyceae sp. YPF-701]
MPPGGPTAHKSSGAQAPLHPSEEYLGAIDEGGGDADAPAQPRSSNHHGVDMSPQPWDEFWDKSEDVHIPERGTTFRVYRAGDEGAVLFCLHGGGYTGLSWSLLARELKTDVQVVAYDMRGHGESRSDAPADLSAATLVADAVAVWQRLFPAAPGRAPPQTIVAGHSMGGAVAVKACLTGRIATLAGLLVVDVVEGTAVASLPHMRSVLAKRPQRFESLSAAAEWGLSTGMTHSRAAARVSLPSCLVREEGGSGWVWRTPLVDSEGYWEGWYVGLSGEFLQTKCPKVLVLAGTDRLDKTLMIGQMQGKFQMVVVPDAGHAVQEDSPGRMAEVLREFIARYRIGQEAVVIPTGAAAAAARAAASKGARVDTPSATRPPH